MVSSAFFLPNTDSDNWAFGIDRYWILILYQGVKKRKKQDFVFLVTTTTIHSTKSKEICVWQIISVVTMLLDNTSYTVGKPVYFPFKWCHICKEHALGGLGEVVVVSSKTDCLHVFQPAWHVLPHCLIKFFHVICLKSFAKLLVLKFGSIPATPPNYSFAYWISYCFTGDVIQSKIWPNSWHVASSVSLTWNQLLLCRSKNSSCQWQHSATSCVGF